MFQRTLLVSAISMAILSGCSDGNNVVVEGDDETNAGGTNQPSTGVETRSLKQLDDNDAFFDALREGLSQQNPNNQVFPSIGVAEEVFLESAAVDTADAVSAPLAPVAESVTDGASTSDSADVATSAPNVTTTNVQEVGVDEQDRMKSDGEYLYIIDNSFNFDFPVFTNGPTPEIEPAIDIGIADSGFAGDEFFPGVGPTVTSKVRILQLQNDAPDAQAINDVEFDLNGAAADGMYMHKSDGNTNLILTGSSFPNYATSWYDPYAFNNATTVVGKMDVTNPEQASMTSTLKIDGQVVSSRRIGDNLFIATRYYPSIPGVEPYNLSPEEYNSAVENADLWTALPKITSDDGSVVAELVNPSECFVSTQTSEDTFFYSPDIVSLSVIDLNSMQLQDSECFLGSTETLYATPNSVYLATTQWDYNFPVFAIDDTVSTTSYVDPRVNTDIHQFSINGSELSYSGSGSVSGHLGWNPDRMPFRMSEQGDYLRVATFSENQDGNSSPINVSVLNVGGDGALTTAAVLPNENRPAHIGKPGEQLYASRFLGDKGYLVTFRQTDPLYVVDFSDHNDPFLAGELEIDGYSDYLQPIDENYLLGIGRDAIASNDGFGGAFILGVKLSLFNVSDPSNPTEVQSMVIGERGTYSDALNNHRAITVQRATDSHPTRVAFGINVFGQESPGQGTDPFRFNNWNYTGLHGFDVTTGDGAAIEQRGVMKVSSADQPAQGQDLFGNNDRSVIVDDSTYYIFGSSVYAANWNDLGNFTGPR